MTCLQCGDDSSSPNAKYCEGCGHPFCALAPSPAPAPAGARLACGCDAATCAVDADGFCSGCGVRGAAAGTSNALHRVEEADARLAMVSDRGRRHANNEDCGHVGRMGTDAALLVVADGVSTSFHAAGASALAIEVVTARLAAPDATDPGQAMASAIMAAHAAIAGMALGADPMLDEPECTVVAATVADDAVTVGWIGDSRAYLVGATSERRLTVDDSWIEQVVAAGTHTREAANADRLAHCVTQVLGMRDAEVEVHVATAGMAADELLLLCSDGLWNYFQCEGMLAARIAQLRRETATELTAATLCAALVDDANRAGGHDNITVAILMAS